MLIVQNNLYVDFDNVKEAKVYDSYLGSAVVKNVLMTLTLDDPDCKEERFDFLNSLARLAGRSMHISQSVYLLTFEDGTQIGIGVYDNTLHIGTGVYTEKVRPA